MDGLTEFIRKIREWREDDTAGYIELTVLVLEIEDWMGDELAERKQSRTTRVDEEGNLWELLTAAHPPVPRTRRG